MTSSRDWLAHAWKILSFGIVCSILAGAIEGSARRVLAQDLSEVREPAAPTSSRHHTTVDATRYPWSSVAKLFNSVGGACTGAVIGREQVLTAAHCLYNFRTRRFLPPDAIHALLGYARGSYSTHARVRHYSVGPGYDPWAERTTAAADWAVLDLVEPLPNSIRPLRPARGGLDDRSRIRVGGFAQDRAFVMTADEDCRILGLIANGSLITHDCMIAPGDSGAPLLAGSPDGEQRVLGVAVGIWHDSGTRTGIAAPVPAILSGDATVP